MTSSIQQLFDQALEQHERGRLDLAEVGYRQILRQQPAHADAMHLLGVIAHQCGRHEDAVKLVQNALRLAPRQASYYCNLGQAYRALGRLNEAAAAQRAALQLQPDLLAARINLALVMEEAGDLAGAEEELRPAAAAAPDRPDILVHLGRVLGKLGRLDDALAAGNAAVRLNLQSADAHDVRAGALLDAARPVAAADAAQRAIDIRATDAASWAVVAQAELHMGRQGQAIAHFRRAVELAPDDAGIHDRMLFALLHGDASGDEITRAHALWAERHARRILDAHLPRDTDCSADRRLRIGYVSPDFRDHAVAYFLEPILARHDRERFEIFCYSDVQRPDETTARIRGAVEHWRQTHRMSALALCDLVRRDRIDILVDLALHTHGNRLLVFARRPAPVQVTYLGYCGTTGLPNIQYRLTDARVEPTGASSFGSEEPWRLPHSFCCYRPPAVAPEVTESRVTRDGEVTFGCISNLSKVMPRAVELWARLLREVPRSRMLIKSGALNEESLRETVVKEFAQRDVDPTRVAMRGLSPLRQYLCELQDIDIALDTFPFNGHTNSCHALWMGVPIVTLAGTMPHARVGASLLASLGLSDLVAEDEEDYLRAARKLALDAHRLRKLREELRPRISDSPVRDEASVARQIEQAYREMWQVFVASI